MCGISNQRIDSMIGQQFCGDIRQIVFIVHDQRRQPAYGMPVSPIAYSHNSQSIGSTDSMNTLARSRKLVPGSTSWRKTVFPRRSSQ